jgi:hypothetical protein
MTRHRAGARLKRNLPEVDDNEVSKPQRAAGTYSALDILRHPSRMLRHTGTSAGSNDVSAIREGASLRVSCFLRGSFGAYPRHLRQGMLLLSVHKATWTPYWSIKRRPLDINFGVQSVNTREADHREPNVKKGGTAFGVVAISSFVVVACNGPLGSLDLIVPRADAPLVCDFFKNPAG